MDFRKIGLAPAPKTWPKTDFETKLLIDFMFFEGKRNMVQSHRPVPERLWAQDPALSHPLQRTRKRRSPEPKGLACRQSLGNFRSLADVERLAKQAQRMPPRENACRNLILNQRVASEARFMDQAHGALA